MNDFTYVALVYETTSWWRRLFGFKRTYNFKQVIANNLVEVLGENKTYLVVYCDSPHVGMIGPKEYKAMEQFL